MRLTSLLLCLLCACDGTDGEPSGDGECGGRTNRQCAANEYCDYPRNSCGATDEPGVCMPRPAGCPDVNEPTCACDGQVYSNACDANAAGADLDARGTCTVPAGSFVCGYRQCELVRQYCERQSSDVDNQPDGFTCKSLPGCPSQLPTCGCLETEPCGDLCTGTGQTGLTVTCPGG
jgi:hypothetical protein